LVDLRKEKWTYPLFITISPNPKVKHQVYRGSKKVKLPYSNLTHDEQYNYCLDILKKIYISPDTQIFGSWELNSSKHVHFHLIFTDPSVKNQVTLDFFRRTVANYDCVIYNMARGKGTMSDYMNNIVPVTDSLPERYEYITKDMSDNIELLPYIAWRCPGIDENTLNRENVEICRAINAKPQQQKRKGVKFDVRQFDFDILKPI